MSSSLTPELAVAIVGMAGRFPGARDVGELWSNVRDGVECVSYLDDEELIAAGVDPAVVADPRYVKAASMLADADAFDAELFEYSPREAELMDPQCRVFLECAWAAFEDAGYDPLGAPAQTGVFAGQSLGTYLMHNLRHKVTSSEFILTQPNIRTVLGNGPDFLTTRVAYKLNLGGPAVTVSTACSTSLVAIHMACQSLLSGECQMALAGGVSVYLPQLRGYLYEDGALLSPDGHCRPFDAGASGTIFGRGVGAVLLKPLEEALADGDRVLAVIRGSAVNNDGSARAGFTAPGVSGQARVIAEALASAEVEAESIGYVEAHGTGTPQGDPIELAALTQAYRASTSRTGFCAIGSVKSNFGHLDAAAGMAGLIKTVMMLREGMIPPTLNFSRPNPQIDFASSPFYVNTELQEWRRRGGPRRAGVSSFGLGGTNAHVVLEEAPERARWAGRVRPAQALTLSAKSETALRELASRYEEVVGPMGGEDLVRACHTASTGRAQLRHRLAVVGGTGAEMAAALSAYGRGEPAAGLVAGEAGSGAAAVGRVAFLCTGQGPQYVGMGRELYEGLPVYREAIDRCAAAVEGELGEPLLEVMYPARGREAWAEERLAQTLYTQPALFAVEYALAQVWRSWGVEPDVVLGHSSGEFVAASLAGVFSAEDGMRLSAARGRLMQRTPAGEMMAVRAGEAEVTAEVEAEARAGGLVSVAAVNGPENVVVSGEGSAVRRVGERLAARGIETTPLAVLVGGHSPLMDSVLEELAEAARGIEHRAPELELVSNVTGRVMAAGECTPEYWARHMREPVRFAQGLARTVELGCSVYVEVGPRPVLLGMGQINAPDARALWLPSLRPDRGAWAQLLESASTLWAHGADVDWARLDQDDPPPKVALPTYPFQRQRFWVMPEGMRWNEPSREGALALSSELDELVYSVDWVAAEAGSAGSGAFAPSPSELVGGLVEGGASDDEDVLSALDSAACAAVAYALTELGLTWEPGTRLSPDALVDQLGVAARHRRFAERLLELSAGTGALRQQGGAWVVERAPADCETVDWTALARAHPEHGHEITLLARCARELASVLRGEGDPLEVLFPEGSLDAAEGVYRDSPFSLPYNQAIREAVAAVADHLPPGETLRVLEVGGGTGGTTAEVLTALAGRDVRYTFTDISPSFTAHARSRFAAHEFVDYELLDVERTPREQGFDSGAYHVVVAANVLHATADLKTTLANVHELLAPGGLLILLEVTSRRAWIDLVFGMTPGWWRFADADLRPAHALLSAGQWLALLGTAGFADAVAYPEAGPQGRGALQSVLMARAEKRAAEGSRTDVPGCWVVFEDESGVGAELAERLEAMGERVVTARHGTSVDGAFDCDDRDHYADLLSAATSRADRPLRGVIYLWSLDEPRLEPSHSAPPLALRSLLLVLQELARRDAGRARVWVVTRGVHATEAAASSAGLAQAPTWGFGRVAALEHPELWGGLIDLADGDALGSAEAILAEVTRGDGEDQVAFPDGRRSVARLVPYRHAKAAERMRVRDDACYLVTGGLGALGLQVARWLADKGARHILLVSRTGLGQDVDPEIRARREGGVRQLRERGVDVTIIEADVGDPDQVREVFARVEAEHLPLRGIVHAAGVAWLKPIADMDADDLVAAFRPKVQGGWNLHAETEQAELDFFVLFSSAAASWGSTGLAHYAAANCFLDALARYRAARGLPALSVAWGRWEGEGLTTESQHDWLEKIGMEEFTVHEALAVLERLIGEGCAEATVARIDWGRFKPVYEAKARRPLLERVGRPAGASESPARPKRNILRELRDAPSSARAEVLRGYVARELAAVMGLPTTTSIELDLGLLDMGLDSLMAVQLRNRLEADLQVSVSIRTLMESPSVAALAESLVDALPQRPRADAGPAAGATAEELLSGLDRMSGDEVSALLEQLLGESGQAG